VRYVKLFLSLLALFGVKLLIFIKEKILAGGSK